MEGIRELQLMGAWEEGELRMRGGAGVGGGPGCSRQGQGQLPERGLLYRTPALVRGLCNNESRAPDPLKPDQDSPLLFSVGMGRRMWSALLTPSIST